MADATRRPRVLFYVQHLLGVGHLVRGARVAKALAGAGFDIMLVMGGTSLPALDVGDARVVNLPPVRVGDGGFGALVHQDGRSFDEADQAARRDLLCGHFDRFAPDVLMLEAFPFGRRQMRFELLPLLERARRRTAPPLIAVSIRDILQENRRPARVTETLDHLDRYFDVVLVHGDPRLARLDVSFPEASRFAEKILYTGLVAPPVPIATPDAGDYAVILSVGGGAVGAPLLEAALLGRARTRMAERPWLALTGPNMPETCRARLAEIAGAGVVLRSFVPDLVRLLRTAELSISQAGYNTVADVLVAGCHAVVVPFASDGETEQTTRARLLDDMGLAICVDPAKLKPQTLAEAIDRALALAPHPHGLDLDGADATARVISDRLTSGTAGLRF